MCKNMNSDLVCVDDYYEWLFLKRNVPSGSLVFWIGPNDIVNEGTWECEEKPLSFTAWMANEPKVNGQNKDCAEFYYPYGFWKNTKCSKGGRRYICEK